MTLSGVYTCRLENQYGSLEADFHVQIVNNIENKNEIFSALFGSIVVVSDGINSNTNNGQQPIIAAQPLNSTVRTGNTANFECKVQWGKDVPMIRVIISLSKSNLFLSNLTKVLKIRRTGLLLVESF